MFHMFTLLFEIYRFGISLSHFEPDGQCLTRLSKSQICETVSNQSEDAWKGLTNLWHRSVNVQTKHWPTSDYIWFVRDSWAPPYSRVESYSRAQPYSLAQAYSRAPSYCYFLLPLYYLWQRIMPYDRLPIDCLLTSPSHVLGPLRSARQVGAPFSKALRISRLARQASNPAIQWIQLPMIESNWSQLSLTESKSMSE